MSATVLSMHPEHQVLTAFWVMVRAEQDRMDLIKQMTAIRVRRPKGWSAAAQRKAFDAGARPRGYASQCLACWNRDRPRVWHHVIQLQHGGSNAPDNLVPLCELCHARIHPWLTAPDPVRLSGWSSMADVIVGNYQTLERMLEGQYEPAAGENWREA